MKYLWWSLPVFGLTTAGSFGYGVAAYGTEGVASESSPLTVYAIGVPEVPRPTASPVYAERATQVSWAGFDDQPGVERYLVTRHVGGAEAVACEVPAGRESCVDRAAPPGEAVTYTVTAAFGESWVGTESEPSAPLTLPTAPVSPRRPQPDPPVVVPTVVVTPTPSPTVEATTQAPTVVEPPVLPTATVEPPLPTETVSPPAPPVATTSPAPTDAPVVTPAPVPTPGEISIVGVNLLGA